MAEIGVFPDGEQHEEKPAVAVSDPPPVDPSAPVAAAVNGPPPLPAGRPPASPPPLPRAVIPVVRDMEEPAGSERLDAASGRVVFSMTMTDTQPRWPKWGMTLVAGWVLILVLVGAAWLARGTRGGSPRRAAATATIVVPSAPTLAAKKITPPTAVPATPTPVPTTSTVDGSPRQNDAAPGAVAPGAAAADVATPPPAVDPFADSSPAAKPAARIPLPNVRDMDKELKDFALMSEFSGLRVSSSKTYRSYRGGPGYTTQPVQVVAAGGFEHVVAMVQKLQASSPHVSVENLGLSPNRGKPSDRPLAVEMLLHWRLAADEKTGAGAGVAPNLPPQPDIGRMLASLSDYAGDRVTFLALSLRSASTSSGAGQNGGVATGRPLTAMLTGVAPSDVDVAAFINKLSSLDGIRDGNLVVAEPYVQGGQTVRRFTMEFGIRGDAKPASADATAAVATIDPFRVSPVVASKAPPTTQPSAARVATAAAAPSSATPDRSVGRDPAMRAAQRLKLQAIMAKGARRSCMINNVHCQEGSQVGQFTVDAIQEGAVIVRSGKFRFELTMTK